MSPIYHPPTRHYDHGAIQPIDFMESFFTPEQYRGYLKGNIVKYIARYEAKGGLADLEKAGVYLKWLVELEEQA
jgi:hypothetical protein